VSEANLVVRRTSNTRCTAVGRSQYIRSKQLERARTGGSRLAGCGCWATMTGSVASDHRGTPPTRPSGRAVHTKRRRSTRPGCGKRDRGRELRGLPWAWWSPWTGQRSPPGCPGGGDEVRPSRPTPAPGPAAVSCSTANLPRRPTTAPDRATRPRANGQRPKRGPGTRRARGTRL